MSRKLANLGMFFGWFVSLASANSPDLISVKTFTTHSRLILRLDPGVETNIKNSVKQFEIFLNRIDLFDLGAPIGSGNAWLSQFSDIKDPRLAGMTVEDSKKGIKITGKWRYPIGNETPAYPKMEIFDYREKDPPSYVIDFWWKQGPTVGQEKIRLEKEKRETALRDAEKFAKVKAERRAASQKSKLEAGDTMKFCREPLKDTTDAFVAFQPAHRKVDFTRWFSLANPDQDYPYSEPKGDSQESQYVRLAVKMYRQGKPGLAIKTIEFLEKEYPASGYAFEMKFLRANALLKLGMKDQSIGILETLALDAKGKPVGLHSAKFLAGIEWFEGHNLKALEKFSSLFRDYPEHQLNWVFHLGAAEALYSLNQTDLAAKEYEWVVEHAPEKSDQADAGFRLGDLYLLRREHALSLAAYYKGIKFFPKEAEAFPEIHLNRGESLYWLGQYEKAKKVFEDYLVRYPTLALGWRASFRIAEIYGRQAAPAAQKDFRKWMYKTINDFPSSPGAVLSRLRLLPCDDHAGFKYESAKNFFENEAEKINGENELFMDQYSDLVVLTRARAWISFEEESEAVKYIASVYTKKLMPQTRGLLSAAFTMVFRKEIVKLLEKGENFKAIEFYDSFSKLIPKDGVEYLPDFLLKLSMVASDYGLGELALKLVELYKERRLARKETTGTIGKIDDELFVSDESFPEAKALWVSKGISSEAKIRELLEKVSDESAYSFEKAIILSLIHYKMERWDEALKSALNAHLLVDPQSVGSTLQIQYWVSVLQRKVGQSDSALQQISGLVTQSKNRSVASLSEAPLSALGLSKIPDTNSLIMEKAEILEGQDKWGEAATAYSFAIDGGDSSGRTKFSYGRALLKTGAQNDKVKSVQVFKEVALNTKEEFWSRLAHEALANQGISIEKTKEGK